MLLILWRHASANVFTSGYDRPLDPTGHLQAKQSGQWLQTYYPNATLWTSKMTRAQETGAYYGKGEAIHGLNVNQFEGDIYDLLTLSGEERLIAVGHLPWIGHLAALLEGRNIPYRNVNHSMVLVFEGSHESGWKLIDTFQPQPVSV